MKRLHHLLIVESEPALAKAILNALGSQRSFEVEWVRTLSGGIARLSQGGIGAVAINLFLTDSRGIDTLDALLRAARDVPVLILCAPHEERIAELALQQGAQDYLLTDHVDAFSVTRALTHMIERKTLEDALFVEQERASVTLDSIGDAVLGADHAGNVTSLNVVAEAMTGWSREDASGRPVADVFKIVDRVTREPCRNPMDVAVQQNRTVGLTPRGILIRRDGSESAIDDFSAPIHDQAGHLAGAVIVFHDVSVSRDLSRRISHVAQHDLLTELPNRTLLNDRLTLALSMARRRRNRIAVLCLDLDRFKHVNDSRGHVVGDELLRMVAERLTACVRRSDTVSRQSGDEFVVLLTDLEHAHAATISATKIMAALALPYTIDHDVLYVPVSIGASTYPEDGRDAGTLLKNADTAMYIAKDNGRNNCQFFKPEMNVRAAERQFIEGSLRQALERHELSLQYQPKIHLETGAMTGVEALLRWRHPERGLIPPAQFVPIAEESSLILPIGHWVLREACRQARAWMDRGLRRIPVAVNVSAMEFRNKDFLEGVQAILKETGLEPRLLELELTETALMQHPDSAATALQALKDLGVQLAVDDFGTGYSSLSYLRDFPIDALKVDQSFVHEISSNPDDAAIVSAVISMGNSMKKRVIAEGVETREQLGFLQAQGCDEGQGYYFHRPMVPDQFARLLKAGPSQMQLN